VVGKQSHLTAIFNTLNCSVFCIILLSAVCKGMLAVNFTPTKSFDSYWGFMPNKNCCIMAINVCSSSLVVEWHCKRNHIIESYQTAVQIVTDYSALSRWCDLLKNRCYSLIHSSANGSVVLIGYWEGICYENLLQLNSVSTLGVIGVRSLEGARGGGDRQRPPTPFRAVAAPP